MPHCIIEHSTTLDANALIDAVHQGAVDSGLFAANAIKTRAISFQHHRCDDVVDEFVHVNCKILSGRSDEQKVGLSQAVLASLDELQLSNISITVEVSDLDRGSYAKRVIE